MKKLPMIDRSNMNFDESESHEIGYAEGLLSDDRPYRLECWAEDQITCITIFVSTIGIEDFTSDQVMDYLEKEGLYKLLDDKYKGEARQCTDPKGNSFWSANLAIGMEDELYADSKIPLKPYKRSRGAK